MERGSIEAWNVWDGRDDGDGERRFVALDIDVLDVLDSDLW